MDLIPHEDQNFPVNHIFYLRSRNIERVLKGKTAQKVMFSIKDFFSKCDQIRRKLRIW